MDCHTSGFDSKGTQRCFFSPDISIFDFAGACRKAVVLLLVGKMSYFKILHRISYDIDTFSNTKLMQTKY